MANSNDISAEFPDGEDITFDDQYFKSINQNNIDLEADTQLESKYIPDDEYKSASEAATDKYNVETEIKELASSSLYIPESENQITNKELVVLKEGTIIGRTMTDAELLEDIRKDSANGTLKTGSYQENRPSKFGRDEDDRVIGNYIRIIMRDLDDTPVENVEDYMKLETDGASGDLEIHFIDPDSRVDAIYIKIGDKSMFIDGGFHWDAPAEIEYLQRLGITKIDYYLGSHAHSNHVGAAGPIIETFDIDTIYYGPQTYGGKSSVMVMMKQKATASELQAINSCEEVMLNVGDVLEINGLTITCLGPIKTFSVEPSAVKENYNSLILRFEYGDCSFLLAGDTSGSQLLDADKNSPGSLQVDLYKNSHHNGTLSQSVLELIAPEYVVFTTKDGYLPTQEYLQRITNLPAEYYLVTTQKDGNVLVTCDGNDLEITPKYNLPVSTP